MISRKTVFFRKKFTPRTYFYHKYSSTLLNSVNTEELECRRTACLLNDISDEEVWDDSSSTDECSPDLENVAKSINR